MSSKEILLVNLSAHCSKQTVYYSIPIGLYCLESIVSEKISVIDRKANILDETIVALNENVKSVICLIPELYNYDTVKEFCSTIKNKFPNILIGLNCEIQNFTQFSDFIIKGTGKKTIYRILRGEKPKGEILEQSENDLEFLPPNFTNDFTDNGYEIAPEKLVTAKTLEIYKPWYGLQERNTQLKQIPPIEWFSKLCEWLLKGGYNGFHFTPANYEKKLLSQLSSIFESKKCKYAISFDNNQLPDLSGITPPLSQIWFYLPSNTETLLNQIRDINKSCAIPCLLINKKFMENNTDYNSILSASRLVIIDEEEWNKKDLRQLLKKYWWNNARFIKRLFSLRHATELVAFIKSSYKMLDILITKEDI